MRNQFSQVNSTDPKLIGFKDINMKGLQTSLIHLLVITVLFSGIVSLTSAYADEVYDDFEQFEDQSREKFEKMHGEFEEKRWALEDSFNEKRMALEDDISQQYRALEDQLNEERWTLEDEFHEIRTSLGDDIDRQFRELDSEFEDLWRDFDYTSTDPESNYDFEKQQLENEHHEKRAAIEEGMNREMRQLDEYIQDAMRELENNFEDKRRALDESSRDKFRELDLEFQKEFRYVEEEFDEERRVIENDSRDQRHSMETKFREHRMQQEKSDRYRDDYRNDDDFMKMVPPEDFEMVEMTKNKILAKFSMEEIDSYWDRGDKEGLLSEILARTDLTRAQVEKIFEYAEKFEGKHMDEYDKYTSGSHDEQADNSYDFNRLEKRVQELEDENKELRSHISDLEKSLVALNQVVLEQIKVIYDWILVR